MGIKTRVSGSNSFVFRSLKNLPTTWGLRLIFLNANTFYKFSEKPPHHMGIKTQRNL